MNKLLTFTILIVLSITPAFASSSNGTVIRSFSTTNIGQGETLTVTLTPGGFVAEGFYQMYEILPEGFVFNSANSDDVNVSGRDVIFTKMSGASLRYNVTTPQVTGVFVFNGTFSDSDRNNGTTNGSNQIVVWTTAVENSGMLPAITRELSKNYTYLENNTDGIVVTLKTTETGFVVYGIVETLPENITVSLIENSSVNMTRDGNNYTFITFGMRDSNPVLLQYVINAKAGTRIGNHTISGYYKNAPNNTVSISPNNTFRVVSNIFQAYDINDDNILERSEMISAVWDYFTHPSKIGFDDVVRLIRQYLVL